MMTRKTKPKRFAIGFPIVTKGRANEPGYVRYIYSDESLDINSFKNSGTYEVFSKIRFAIKVNLISFFKGSEAKVLAGSNYEGQSDALAAYTLANSFDNFELDRNTKKIPILLITGDIEFTFDQKIIGNFHGTTFPNILKIKNLSDSQYYRDKQTLAKTHLIDKVAASLRASAQFDGAILSIPKQDLSLIQEEDDFRQLENISVCSSASAANKLVKKQKLIILPVRSGFFSIGKLFDLAGTRKKPRLIIASMTIANLALLGTIMWNMSLPIECHEDDFWSSKESVVSCFFTGLPAFDRGDFNIIVFEHSSDYEGVFVKEFKNKFSQYRKNRRKLIENELEDHSYKESMLSQVKSQDWRSIRVYSINNRMENHYDMNFLNNFVKKDNIDLVILGETIVQGELREYRHNIVSPPISKALYKTKYNWNKYSYFDGEFETEIDHFWNNFELANSLHPFAIPRYTIDGNSRQLVSVDISKKIFTTTIEPWFDAILFHFYSRNQTVSISKANPNLSKIYFSEFFLNRITPPTHSFNSYFLSIITSSKYGMTPSQLRPTLAIQELHAPLNQLSKSKKMGAIQSFKEVHLQSISLEERELASYYYDKLDQYLVGNLPFLSQQEILNVLANTYLDTVEYYISSNLEVALIGMGPAQKLKVLAYYLKLSFLSGAAQSFLDITVDMIQIAKQSGMFTYDDYLAFLIHNWGVANRIDDIMCHSNICINSPDIDYTNSLFRYKPILNIDFIEYWSHAKQVHLRLFLERFLWRNIDRSTNQFYDYMLDATQLNLDVSPNFASEHQVLGYNAIIGYSGNCDNHHNRTVAYKASLFRMILDLYYTLKSNQSENHFDAKTRFNTRENWIVERIEDFLNYSADGNIQFYISVLADKWVETHTDDSIGIRKIMTGSYSYPYFLTNQFKIELFSKEPCQIE